MQIDRIVVITRPTRLEENVKRYNTKAQAKFVIRSRGQSFDDYELEQSHYEQSKEMVMESLPRGVPVQMLDRGFLPNFIFGPKDVVVVLGQDGLVVNVAKYLAGQPLIAVNPDPDRFDGVLLPFQTSQLKDALGRLEADHHKIRRITMARVDLNDGQILYAFNDFFVGIRNHTSARYTLHFEQREERQSSCGIIVSTPAGSTGWLQSVFNMSRGVNSFLGDDSTMQPEPLSWEERQLVFVVREPFRSKWSGADLVAGRIVEGASLRVESHMPEGGVIFSDGLEADHLDFNSGATATIGLAEKATELVVG